MKAEELLLHADFVKKLARQLVWDDNQAADLAQDTFLAALQHSGAKLESQRAWLATVVRNFRGKFHRGETRRARREEVAALPDIVPSTEEIITREELRSKVVRAVLDLKEPYRSHILLRFYEDMPPRLIARHVGAPTETVRTRIKKGLDLLRGRLDDEYGGDRKALCLALIPLAGLKAGAVATAAGTGTSTSLIGALLMTAKWKFVLATVLTLATTIGLYTVYSDGQESVAPEDPQAAIVRAADPSDAPAVANPLSEEPGDDLKDRLRQLGYLNEEKKVSMSASGAIVRGRVVDGLDQAVAGARIEIHYLGGAPSESASFEIRVDIENSVSESDGRFRFPIMAPGRYRIHAETDSGLRSTRQTVDVGNKALPELVLVVGTWHEISGRVLSEETGKPVVDATVTAMGVGDSQRYDTRTDGDGRYLLQGLSRTSFKIDVTASGFGQAMKEGVDYDSEGVDFKMQKSGSLRGAVCDATTGLSLDDFQVQLVPVSELSDSPASMNEALRTVLLQTYFRQQQPLARLHEFSGKKGRFSIAPVASGLYRVAVGSKGYGLAMLPEPLMIEPGKETYRQFDLAPARSFDGRIVDEYTNVGIEGAVVKQFKVSDPFNRDDALLDRRSTISDWDGNFVYSHADAGMNLIEIIHPDYQTKVASLQVMDERLALTKGGQPGISIEEDRVIVALLQKGKPGILQVRIDPQIMESCTVPPVIGLFNERGKSEIVVPDEEGLFFGNAMDPGMYNILLMAGGEVKGNKTMRIDSGKTTPVQFGGAGATGSSLHGSLLVGSERFEGSGMVCLIQYDARGNHPKGMVQIEDGKFSLEDVGSGEGELNLYLSVGPGSGTCLYRKFSWGETPEQHLELALPMTELMIEVVTDEQPEGVQGAAIELHLQRDNKMQSTWMLKTAARAMTDEKGRSTVQCIPEGNYTLKVSAKGCENYTNDLLIVEGKPVEVQVRLFAE